jgi:hypothetical protein
MNKMGWLAALIAVLVFGWLLVRFPRFRITVIVVVVGLVAIVIYLINSENERTAKSHSLILPSQLEFRDVRLQQTYGSWKNTGNVKNNSAHTLTDLKLKVMVRDCDDSSACTVIGEDDDVFVWVTVPPSQLRSFDTLVSLRNIPTPKKVSWNYQIVQTTAE